MTAAASRKYRTFLRGSPEKGDPDINVQYELSAFVPPTLESPPSAYRPARQLLPSPDSVHDIHPRKAAYPPSSKESWIQSFVICAQCFQEERNDESPSRRVSCRVDPGKTDLVTCFFMSSFLTSACADRCPALRSL
jgi:hypothetical protein